MSLINALEMGSAPASVAVGRALAAHMGRGDCTHDLASPSAPMFVARARRTAAVAAALPISTASLPLTLALLISLASLLPCSTPAHDAYEITSVVYLQTNRIELFVEMEFPTAMKLAGLSPTRDVAVLSQFEAGLPKLMSAAGGFYEITAANNVIQPLSTNVELVVDDHIQFRVEFANTTHRPLRFAARSLKALAEQGGYGASLTVLDMVHKKVLGQTTLFADATTMEFSVTNRTVQPASPAPPPVDQTHATFSNFTDTNTTSTHQPVSKPADESRPQLRWATMLTAFLVALTVAFFIKQKAKK